MKKRNEVKHPIAQNLDAAIARVLALDKEFDRQGYVRDGLEWDCAMIDLAKFAKLRQLEQKARAKKGDVEWLIEEHARKIMRETRFITFKKAKEIAAESLAESVMEDFGES
jgi:hypothetical protein